MLGPDRQPTFAKNKPEGITSPEAREKFYHALEFTLKSKLNEWSPSTPKKERKTENIPTKDGRSLGHVIQIRNPRRAEHPRAGGGEIKREDLWLIIDFDDVLNKTTTFQRDLNINLANLLGIDVDKVNKIYENSKIENEQGKQVFRFGTFIATLKTMDPAKAEQVDNLIANIKYGAYVDQAVKRALLAARWQHLKTVRISILTYGDPNYQQMRLDKTDLDEVVDDFIFTEGSKRDVLEGLAKQQYKDSPPDIITVDDSPDQLEDLDKISDNVRFLNIRFRNPQAKRYSKESKAPGVVNFNENSINEAAVDIFRLSQLVTLQGLRHGSGNRQRSELIRVFRDPKLFDEFYLHHTAGDIQKNVEFFYEPNGSVSRKADFTKGTRELKANGEYKRNLGIILEGKELPIDPRYSEELYPDFIKSAL